MNFWKEKKLEGISRIQSITNLDCRHATDVDAMTVQALDPEDLDEIEVGHHADLIDVVQKVLVLSANAQKEHDGLRFGDWTLKRFRSSGEQQTLYRDGHGPAFAVLAKTGRFRNFVGGRRWYWWGGWLDCPDFRQALDAALEAVIE